jgi:hypothetical protein
MERNPYAPPTAPVAAHAGDGAPVAPVMPLYTTNQIAVATFLASAVAGAWLMAANFRAIGLRARARNAVLIGIGVTIATIVLGFLLPDRVPNFVLPVAVAFGIRALAERHFATLIAEHIAAGGELRSGWRVAGITLAVLAILFAAAFVGVFGYYFFHDAS